MQTYLIIIYMQYAIVYVLGSEYNMIIMEFNTIFLFKK